MSWPDGGHPRRAAVSSFGLSGTNAHLILESAEIVESTEEDGPAPRGGQTGHVLAWVISGRSEQALRAQAVRLRAHIQTNPDLDPADVGYSLATTRTHHGHRAVLLIEDRESAVEALQNLIDGRPAPALIHGRAAAWGRRSSSSPARARSRRAWPSNCLAARPFSRGTSRPAPRSWIRSPAGR